MASRPEPLTLPRCVFRSFVPTTVGIGPFSLAGDAATSAVSQSLTCQRLFAHAVPPSLLQECIRDDCRGRMEAGAGNGDSSRSTLLAVTHGGEDLLVHCDGEDLSTLVARPVSSLLRHHLSSAPGFSLSNESAVVNLFQSGGASWMPEAVFSAQSAYELRQYRTVNAADHLPGRGMQEKQDERGSLIILEPLLRTRFPELIAAANATALETLVLTISGRLFFWNNGVVAEHSANPLFSSRGEVRSLRVAGTLHPLIAQASQNQALYLVDKRVSRPNKLFSLEHDIAAVKQHPGHSSLGYLAFHSTLAMFDVRFTSAFVDSHPTPGTHSILGESFPSESGGSHALSYFLNGCRPILGIQLLLSTNSVSLSALQW